MAPQQTQAVEERQQITAFSNDEAVVPEQVPGEVTLPKVGTSQFTDDQSHNIHSYLQRPQLLQSIRWPIFSDIKLPEANFTISNKRNQDLLYVYQKKYPLSDSYPANLQDNIYNNGLAIPGQMFRPMVKKKLDGFSSFRATAVFKLQINSQPFLAGRLIMSAIPMPSLLGDRGRYVESTISNMQNVNHVQMDINKQTEVQLRIPFISPYNAYDLITGNFDWSKLKIKIYSPIASTATSGGGTTGCSDNVLQLLLWGHFEDIELGFPTSALMYKPVFPSAKTNLARQQSNPIVVLKQEKPKFDITKTKYKIIDESKVLTPTGETVEYVTHHNKKYALINNSWIPIPKSQSKPLPNIKEQQQYVKVKTSDQSFYIKTNLTYLPKAQMTSRVPPKEVSAVAAIKSRISESTGRIATVSSQLGNMLSCGVEAIGGVASLFGFSKPQKDTPGISVVNRPAQYFGNYNGIDHSHVVALSATNNVETFPNLAGTNIDETSFEFLKRVPNFIGAFNYDNKCSMGGDSDILTYFYVAPTYYQPMVASASANVFDADTGKPKVITYLKQMKIETSLSYNCSPFVYWTGSLVYTFRFIKTDYHSGRVEISFHPFSSNIPDGSQDDGRFDFVYRVVVDLRDNSEVSITVPYVSPQQWKTLEYDRSIFDPYNISIQDSALPLRYATGMLVVRKLTPLICQSTVVSPKIECLVEVRGGPDFRVACPAHSPLHPFSFPKAQSGNMKQIKKKKGSIFVRCFKTQVSGEFEDEEVIRPVTPLPKAQSGPVYAVPGTQDTRSGAIMGFVPPSITGNDSDLHHDDTSMLTQGEVFACMRALTRRHCFTQQVSLKSIPYVLPPTYNKDKDTFVSTPQSYLADRKVPSVILKISDFLSCPELPYNIITRISPTPKNGSGPSPDNRYYFQDIQIQPSILNSPLSFVASMYCFYRGGLRFKAVLRDGAGGSDTLTTNELVSGRVIYRNIHDNNQSLEALESDISYNVTDKFMSPKAFELSSAKTIAEFQVPYYSPTIQSCHWNANYTSLQDRPCPWLEISSSVRRYDTVLNIATGASDDTDFILYLGPPPHVGTAYLLRKHNTNYKVNIPTSVGDPVDGVYPVTSLSSQPFNSTLVTYVDVYGCDPAYALNKNENSVPSAADFNSYQQIRKDKGEIKVHYPDDAAQQSHWMIDYTYQKYNYYGQDGQKHTLEKPWDYLTTPAKSPVRFDDLLFEEMQTIANPTGSN